VSDVWIVSMVLAWIVIALLVAVVLSLLRQLGALRLMVGAGPGRRYDDVAEVRLYDPVEGFGGEPTLLVFHQRGCVGCEEIPAALETLAADASTQVRIVSVEDAGADLPSELRAHATPAVIGVAREGVVCVLGRANTLPQLREAAEAVAGAIVVSPGSERLMEWGVCAPYWELSREGAAPGTASGSAGTRP
jgi:hypothetical protein